MQNHQNKKRLEGVHARQMTPVHLIWSHCRANQSDPGGALSEQPPREGKQISQRTHGKERGQQARHELRIGHENEPGLQQHVIEGRVGVGGGLTDQLVPGGPGKNQGVALVGSGTNSRDVDPVPGVSGSQTKGCQKDQAEKNRPASGQIGLVIGSGVIIAHDNKHGSAKRAAASGPFPFRTAIIAKHGEKTVARKKKSDEPKVLNVKPLLKQISKEKDLEPEVIKSAVEMAIMSAATKRSHQFESPRPELDIESGDMRIYVKKKVVMTVDDSNREIDIIAAKARDADNMMGDEIEVEMDPEEFGRIAAQSVRQGILQRLRDAERDRIHSEYKDQVGKVVTGIVQRYERRDCIVALGKVECLLPAHEIPFGVRYRYGDRIRCLIIDVRRTPKGPQVILSRTRSELVKQLFATEVPEISDGTVRIVEIAREPGVRTKIAVNSMNPDVDPVGACVGMKGSRVQMIVRELDNEKVDIVPYSAISENFISSALNPAEIINIKLNELEKRAQVIVTRESLAKAIGKRGQNAKLAAKLTGWKIDVSEQEDAAELARIESISLQYLNDFLNQIDGLSAFAKEALTRTQDYNTVEKLAECEPEQLLSFTGDDQELAEDIVDGAKEYLEKLQELTQSSDDAITDEMRERLKNVESLADRLAGGAAAVSVNPEGNDVETADGGTPPDPDGVPAVEAETETQPEVAVSDEPKTEE